MPEKGTLCTVPGIPYFCFISDLEAIFYDNDCVKSFISLTLSYIKVYKHNFYHFKEI